MLLLRSNLERLQSTLVLMLNVITNARMKTERSEISFKAIAQRKLIENLNRSNQKYARKFEKMKGGIMDKTATADLLDPPHTSEDRDLVSDSETEAETSSSKSGTSEIQDATSDIGMDTLDTQEGGLRANAHCAPTENWVIPSVETESKEESKRDDASRSSQDILAGEGGATKFRALPPRLLSSTDVRTTSTNIYVLHRCNSAIGISGESSSHHQLSEDSHREDPIDDGLLKHLEWYILLINNISRSIDDMPEALSLEGQRIIKSMLSQAFTIETGRLAAAHGQSAVEFAKKSTVPLHCEINQIATQDIKVGDDVGQPLTSDVSHSRSSGVCETRTENANIDKTTAAMILSTSEDHAPERNATQHLLSASSARSLLKAG